MLKDHSQQVTVHHNALVVSATTCKHLAKSSFGRDVEKGCRIQDGRVYKFLNVMHKLGALDVEGDDGEEEAVAEKQSVN